MKTRKINVAIVGLGFGGCFPPVYLEHPDVGRVAVCDADAARLNAYADHYGFKERFTNLKEVLVPEFA